MFQREVFAPAGASIRYGLKSEQQINLYALLQSAVRQLHDQGAPGFIAQWKRGELDLGSPVHFDYAAMQDDPVFTDHFQLQLDNVTVDSTDTYRLMLSSAGMAVERELIGFRPVAVLKLQLQVTTQASRDILRPGESISYAIPKLRGAMRTSNRFLWLKYQFGTNSNYRDILEALRVLVAQLPSGSADVRLGKERWAAAAQFDIFSDLIRDKDRSVALSFSLLYAQAYKTVPSEAEFRAYSTAIFTHITGQLQTDPRSRLNTLLVEAAQRVAGVDLEYIKLLVYQALISLNLRFGKEGEREYDVLPSSSNVLTLSQVSEADSATYICFEMGKFDERVDLQAYPSTANLDSRDMLTFRGVFRLEVLQSRTESVQFSYGKQHQFEVVKYPKDNAKHAFSGAEPESYHWKRLNVSASGTLLRPLFKATPKRPPYRHIEEGGLYAYTLRKKSLEFPQQQSPIPFMLEQADSFPVAVPRKVEGFKAPGVCDLFVPIVDVVNYSVQTGLPPVTAPLGSSLNIDITSVTAGEKLRWTRENSLLGVHDLGRAARVFVPRTTEEHAGTYFATLKLNARNGIPAVHAVFTVTADLTGFCKRCEVSYTAAENRHGACQWHTRPTDEMRAEFDPRSSELVPALISGVVARNPNLHWGIIKQGSHQEWACCGLHTGHPGCWKGRHNYRTAAPDLHDWKHNAPERGTEHINDLYATPQNHKDIIDAYREDDWLRGVTLELLFNNIHGGYMEPAFLATELGRQLRTQVLGMRGTYFDEHLMRALLPEALFDESFGMWSRRRELQEKYINGASVQLFDADWAFKTVEMFQLFWTLRVDQRFTDFNTRLDYLNSWLVGRTKRAVPLLPGQLPPKKVPPLQPKKQPPPKRKPPPPKTQWLNQLSTINDAVDHRLVALGQWRTTANALEAEIRDAQTYLSALPSSAQVSSLSASLRSLLTKISGTPAVETKTIVAQENNSEILRNAEIVNLATEQDQAGADRVATAAKEMFERGTRNYGRIPSNAVVNKKKDVLNNLITQLQTSKATVQQSFAQLESELNALWQTIQTDATVLTNDIARIHALRITNLRDSGVLFALEKVDVNLLHALGNDQVTALVDLWEQGKILEESNRALAVMQRTWLEAVLDEDANKVNEFLNSREQPISFQYLTEQDLRTLSSYYSTASSNDVIQPFYDDQLWEDVLEFFDEDLPTDSRTGALRYIFGFTASDWSAGSINDKKQERQKFAQRHKELKMTKIIATLSARMPQTHTGSDTETWPDGGGLTIGALANACVAILEGDAQFYKSVYERLMPSQLSKWESFIGFTTDPLQTQAPVFSSTFKHIREMYRQGADDRFVKITNELLLQLTGSYRGAFVAFLGSRDLATVQAAIEAQRARLLNGSLPVNEVEGYWAMFAALLKRDANQIIDMADVEVSTASDYIDRLLSPPSTVADYVSTKVDTTLPLQVDMHPQDADRAFSKQLQLSAVEARWPQNQTSTGVWIRDFERWKEGLDDADTTFVANEAVFPKALFDALIRGGDSTDPRYQALANVFLVVAYREENTVERSILLATWPSTLSADFNAYIAPLLRNRSQPTSADEKAIDAKLATFAVSIANLETALNQQPLPVDVRSYAVSIIDRLYALNSKMRARSWQFLPYWDKDQVVQRTDWRSEKYETKTFFREYNDSYLNVRPNKGWAREKPPHESEDYEKYSLLGYLNRDYAAMTWGRSGARSFTELAEIVDGADVAALPYVPHEVWTAQSDYATTFNILLHLARPLVYFLRLRKSTDINDLWKSRDAGLYSDTDISNVQDLISELAQKIPNDKPTKAHLDAHKLSYAYEGVNVGGTVLEGDPLSLRFAILAAGTDVQRQSLSTLEALLSYPFTVDPEMLNIDPADSRVVSLLNMVVGAVQGFREPETEFGKAVVQLRDNPDKRDVFYYFVSALYFEGAQDGFGWGLFNAWTEFTVHGYAAFLTHHETVQSSHVPLDISVNPRPFDLVEVLRDLVGDPHQALSKWKLATGVTGPTERTRIPVLMEDSDGFITGDSYVAQRLDAANTYSMKETVEQLAYRRINVGSQQTQGEDILLPQLAAELQSKDSGAYLLLEESFSVTLWLNAYRQRIEAILATLRSKTSQHVATLRNELKALKLQFSSTVPSQQDIIETATAEVVRILTPRWETIFNDPNWPAIRNRFPRTAVEFQRTLDKAFVRTTATKLAQTRGTQMTAKVRKVSALKDLYEAEVMDMNADDLRSLTEQQVYFYSQLFSTALPSLAGAAGITLRLREAMSAYTQKAERLLSELTRQSVSSGDAARPEDVAARFINEPLPTGGAAYSKAEWHDIAAAVVAEALPERYYRPHFEKASIDSMIAEVNQGRVSTGISPSDAALSALFRDGTYEEAQRLLTAPEQAGGGGDSAMWTRRLGLALYINKRLNAITPGLRAGAKFCNQLVADPDTGIAEDFAYWTRILASYAAQSARWQPLDMFAYYVVLMREMSRVWAPDTLITRWTEGALPSAIDTDKAFMKAILHRESGIAALQTGLTYTDYDVVLTSLTYPDKLCVGASSNALYSAELAELLQHEQVYSALAEQLSKRLVSATPNAIDGKHYDFHSSKTYQIIPTDKSTLRAQSQWTFPADTTTQVLVPFFSTDMIFKPFESLHKMMLDVQQKTALRERVNYLPINFPGERKPEERFGTAQPTLNYMTIVAQLESIDAPENRSTQPAWIQSALPTKELFTQQPLPPLITMPFFAKGVPTPEWAMTLRLAEWSKKNGVEILSSHFPSADFDTQRESTDYAGLCSLEPDDIDKIATEMIAEAKRNNVLRGPNSTEYETMFLQGTGDADALRTEYEVRMQEDGTGKTDEEMRTALDTLYQKHGTTLSAWLEVKWQAKKSTNAKSVWEMSNADIDAFITDLRSFEERTAAKLNAILAENTPTKTEAEKATRSKKEGDVLIYRQAWLARLYLRPLLPRLYTTEALEQMLYSIIFALASRSIITDELRDSLRTPNPLFELDAGQSRIKQYDNAERGDLVATSEHRNLPYEVPLYLARDSNAGSTVGWSIWDARPGEPANKYQRTMEKGGEQIDTKDFSELEYLCAKGGPRGVGTALMMRGLLDAAVLQRATGAFVEPAKFPTLVPARDPRRTLPEVTRVFWPAKGDLVSLYSGIGFEPTMPYSFADPNVPVFLNMLPRANEEVLDIIEENALWQNMKFFDRGGPSTRDAHFFYNLALIHNLLIQPDSKPTQPTSEIDETRRYLLSVSDRYRVQGDTATRLVSGKRQPLDLAARRTDYGTFVGVKIPTHERRLQAVVFKENTKWTMGSQLVTYAITNTADSEDDALWMASPKKGKAVDRDAVFIADLTDVEALEGWWDDNNTKIITAMQKAQRAAEKKQKVAPQSHKIVLAVVAKLPAAAFEAVRDLAPPGIPTVYIQYPDTIDPNLTLEDNAAMEAESQKVITINGVALNSVLETFDIPVAAPILPPPREPTPPPRKPTSPPREPTPPPREPTPPPPGVPQASVKPWTEYWTWKNTEGKPLLVMPNIRAALASKADKLRIDSEIKVPQFSAQVQGMLALLASHKQE